MANSCISDNSSSRVCLTGIVSLTGYDVLQTRMQAQAASGYKQFSQPAVHTLLE